MSDNKSFKHILTNKDDEIRNYQTQWEQIIAKKFKKS